MTNDGPCGKHPKECWVVGPGTDRIFEQYTDYVKYVTETGHCTVCRELAEVKESAYKQGMALTRGDIAELKRIYDDQIALKDGEIAALKSKAQVDKDAELNFDREWTQEELKRFLLDAGWSEDQIGNDPIPQGVKWIDLEHTPTEADTTWAQKIIAEHPEWSATVQKKRVMRDHPIPPPIDTKQSEQPCSTPPVADLFQHAQHHFRRGLLTALEVIMRELR